MIVEYTSQPSKRLRGSPLNNRFESFAVAPILVYPSQTKNEDGGMCEPSTMLGESTIFGSENRFRSFDC